jgi:hypothetical protein
MSDLSQIAWTEENLSDDVKPLLAVGLPVDTQDDDFLIKGVKTGSYKRVQINFAEIPSYMVYYHVTRENYLFINAAFTLSTTQHHFHALVKGMESFATKKGFKGILFCSRRRGLLSMALEFGYKTMGVQLFKSL